MNNTDTTHILLHSKDASGYALATREKALDRVYKYNDINDLTSCTMSYFKELKRLSKQVKFKAINDLQSLDNVVESSYKIKDESEICFTSLDYDSLNDAIDKLEEKQKNVVIRYYYRQEKLKTSDYYTLKNALKTLKFYLM